MGDRVGRFRRDPRGGWRRRGGRPQSFEVRERRGRVSVGQRHAGQAAPRGKCDGMLVARGLLPGHERPLEERPRLLDIATCPQGFGHDHERRRQIRMILAHRLRLDVEGAPAVRHGRRGVAGSEPRAAEQGQHVGRVTMLRAELRLAHRDEPIAERGTVVPHGGRRAIDECDEPLLEEAVRPWRIAVEQPCDEGVSRLHVARPEGRLGERHDRLVRRRMAAPELLIGCG